MKNEYIAVILAAGFGNRMKPLKENNHKTLLKVAGETILGRILKNLEEELITDIFIVTGYRDKQLKEYIKQNFSPTIRLFLQLIFLILIVHIFDVQISSIDLKFFDEILKNNYFNFFF